MLSLETNFRQIEFGGLVSVFQILLVLKAAMVSDVLSKMHNVRIRIYPE